MLAAPAAFGGLAGAYDVPFVPLELDMSRVGEAVAGRYGLRHMLRFCQAAGRRTAAVLPALEIAADGAADVVMHHPVLPLGQHVAELLGVPAVVGLAMAALVPTRDVDRWRRNALDLPPRRGRHDPLVCDDGQVDYTIKDMASDLAELIRTVTGGRPAHLHASGGTIALWPLVKARRCSPGCCAASPGCGWPVRRSTARCQPRAVAIRSTMSASSALLVPIVTRTKPSPGAPKLSPRPSATRPRSRNTCAGSGPRPSPEQSTQAR